jgi:IS30 family transposase
LSMAERAEIQAGLAARCSFTAIAAGLGRAVSTVSREVARRVQQARHRCQGDRGLTLAGGLARECRKVR